MIDRNPSIEYRVRPVQRFVVTKFHSYTHPDGLCATGSEVLGEFPSIEQAEQAKQAFEAAGKAPDDFVILQRSYDVATSVYHSRDRAEAEKMASELAAKHGGEWSVYGRDSERVVSVYRYGPEGIPALDGRPVTAP
jgi:hypothetical protein